MELPYSHDVYLVLMDSYNRDHLAFAIAGIALCLFGVVAAVLPAGRQTVIVKRLILAGLAGCSIFVGVAHQLTLMTSLNFMAPVYGTLWILQGLVLLWLTASIRRVDLFEAPAIGRYVGVTVAVYGTILYPALVYAVADSDGIGTSLPGTAPNPTAMVIVGILLTMRGGPPVVTLIVPMLWAVIAGATAYLLAFPVDDTVSLGIGLAIMYGLYARMRRDV